MCGIGGYWQEGHIDQGEGRAVLLRMGDALAQRGPDGSGIWMDVQAAIGLTHRRLAVLDLSAAGHQPMISGSGNLVLVLNGEIYNHSALRQALKGEPVFRGHSDTETLLACFEEWGFERAITRTVGMFALALYDRSRRILYLARDRAGEKPLYYGTSNGTVLFGSDLRAILAHPKCSPSISREAAALYFRLGYVPAPHSIYHGIRKVPPGAYVEVSVGRNDGEWKDGVSPPRRYWSLEAVVANAADNQFQGTSGDAITELDAVLRDATRGQMVADVPLGAFLSGGIDSTTVVALMQSQSSQRVKTFTVGFEEPKYDEAPYAKAVAQHLGTDHTECYVTRMDVLTTVPELAGIYDEPFSDSSQLPTALICGVARRHVTVALSGDGGDELFGGYNRYAAVNKYWRAVRRVPLSVRRTLSSCLRSYLEMRSWAMRAGRISDSSEYGEKLRKFANLLSVQELEAAYLAVVAHWSSSDIVLGTSDISKLLDAPPGVQAQRMGDEHLLMFMDFLRYLPDDVLVKVDRAAMSRSLETRTPYLDHRVIELAWRLPAALKFQAGRTKWILRQIALKYVPLALLDRPKMGFTAPVAAWLRGPLREWAEALLSESRLKRDGYLDASAVRHKWQEHLSGRRNWQADLWNVLMFQQWLERSSAP